MKSILSNTWLQAFFIIAVTSAVLTAHSWSSLSSDVRSWRGTPSPAANVSNPAVGAPMTAMNSSSSTTAVVPSLPIRPAPSPPNRTPVKSPDRASDPKAAPLSSPVGVSKGGTEEFQKAMQFYDGVGVAKDFKRAFDLFQQSAAGGNGASMAKLGWMCWFGEGVEPNAVQGAAWFKRGAQAGNSEAQYWLATFYEKGYGNLKKDNQASLQWLQKSAAQGFPKAVSALKSRSGSQ